ncbi:glycosyltransferase family 4 protein [Georgenia daeguensis]|uniref:D-inositol 3-phosphate glycosyltransferase n=1 Tax=Georgenia daeguensis TaxID=908355 RepID=A0ABP8EU12_9MICO
MTLRVVFLDHTTSHGGAQLALARLLAAGAGWDATVVVPRGPLGAYAGLGGQVVRQTGPPHRPGAIGGAALAQARNAGAVLRQVAALVAEREVRGADVLYANSARSAVYTALTASVLRVPFVVHLRDAVTPEALGRWGFAAMTRLVLPRAAGVVANSRHTLGVAAAAAPLPALRAVVPSPVGDMFDPPPPPPRARVERVGMVARIAPWKGQVLLLDAFARAFPGGDVTLHLAGAPLFGEEDYLARLRERARELGVADRLALHGHVEDVRGFVDSLDIAVHCATAPEPLGQNVLQYLARGRAIVAADEGGPAELVRDGDTGLLVAPRDPAALAVALRRLAADGDLRQALARRAAAAPVPHADELATSTEEFLSRVRAARRAPHARTEPPAPPPRRAARGPRPGDRPGPGSARRS